MVKILGGLMKEEEIKVGLSYTGQRWKGDRKVTKIERLFKKPTTVEFGDLRTMRTGKAELAKFAAGASGAGLVKLPK